MASKVRVFTKGVLVFLNVVAAIAFLLACIAPSLDPDKWWFISFTGLGFPILLLIVVLFMIGWLFVKKRLALISAIVLIFGIRGISTLFAFHISSANGLPAHSKDSSSVRIATWNVARFVEMKRNNNKGSQTRLRMMEQIQQSNADILCLQEFFHSRASDYYPNLTYISRHFNYPYYFFSHDDDGDSHYTGSVIFSRYPIIDSGLIRYPRPTLPDALMHADIKVGKDTIRVYTTHLQSLQFNSGDYERIQRISEGKDGMVSNSKAIFGKLRTAMSNRKIQSDIIAQVLGDSPYPVLFCGDLNDVPHSYTYKQIRGDMQDAFLKKGFGIGRTFSGLAPTLRIDYIFADPVFQVNGFERVVKPYSDHFMLMADIDLGK
ncbi:MAG: endonuclease/exonuclease/phosphatase family protein [Chitinophagaceae bacterium]